MKVEELKNLDEGPSPGERWSGLAFAIARIGAGILILLSLGLFIFYLPRFKLLYWDMNLVRLAVALSPTVPRWLSIYYLIVLQYFTVSVSITVGLLVYYKRVLPSSSRDWTGLLASLTLVMGFLIALQPDAPLYPFTPTFNIEKLLYEIYQVLSSTSIYFLVMFVFVFPDGRFIPRWMRWVALLFSLAIAVFISVPLGFDEFLYFVVAFPVLIAPIMAFIGQVYRYRRVSTRDQRQQTKWVLYSLTVILLSFPIIGLLTPLILPPNIQTLLEFHLNFMAAIILPLSIGVSILRYRLWDIDLIIRRTLVYGGLTMLLALVYFASVVLLQQVFRSLTGQDSPIAVVISTLVIAALFTPLRYRIQEGIDRRFYRQKYDSRQALAAFAASARDEVELEQLSEQLLSVVQASMQPEHLSLWLRQRSHSSIPKNDLHTANDGYN